MQKKYENLMEGKRQMMNDDVSTRLRESIRYMDGSVQAKQLKILKCNVGMPIINRQTAQGTGISMATVDIQIKNIRIKKQPRRLDQGCFKNPPKFFYYRYKQMYGTKEAAMFSLSTLLRRYYNGLFVNV